MFILLDHAFGQLFFVGLTDFFISFMRVERILPILLNDYFVRALGRSAFVGLYIHLPLILLGFVVALYTRP